MIISLFHQGNSHVTLAGSGSEIEKFRVLRGKVEEISTIHHYSVSAAKYQVIVSIVLIIVTDSLRMLFRASCSQSIVDMPSKNGIVDFCCFRAAHF